MEEKVTTILFILAVSLISSLAEDNDSSKLDKCAHILTCSSCLANSFCAWCVNKNRCTSQTCGNDNVIYPENIMALMAGAQFCPRIVPSDNELVLVSGKKEGIIIKLTQIYVYMAYTQWKCKIYFNGKDIVVDAIILADNVFCDPVVLKNESYSPYLNGSVTVLWEHRKLFDGVQPIKVCRCELEPNCAACVK